MYKLGKHIQYLRESSGISVPEISDIIGISEKKYLLIESGITTPNYIQLKKISEVVGVEVKDITKVLENEQITENDKNIKKYLKC